MFYIQEPKQHEVIQVNIIAEMNGKTPVPAVGMNVMGRFSPDILNTLHLGLRDQIYNVAEDGTFTLRCPKLDTLVVNAQYTGRRFIVDFGLGDDPQQELEGVERPPSNLTLDGTRIKTFKATCGAEDVSLEYLIIVPKATLDTIGRLAMLKKLNAWFTFPVSQEDIDAYEAGPPPVEHATGGDDDDDGMGDLLGGAGGDDGAGDDTAPGGDAAGAAEDAAGHTAPDGLDERYDKALAIVRDKGRVSISLVQRHMAIGYNRAARIIEQMERAGVVSPINANGTRELLPQNEGGAADGHDNQPVPGNEEAGSATAKAPSGDNDPGTEAWIAQHGAGG